MAPLGPLANRRSSQRPQTPNTPLRVMGANLSIMSNLLPDGWLMDIDLMQGDEVSGDCINSRSVVHQLFIHPYPSIQSLSSSNLPIFCINPSILPSIQYNCASLGTLGATNTWFCPRHFLKANILSRCCTRTVSYLLRGRCADFGMYLHNNKTHTVQCNVIKYI